MQRLIGLRCHMATSESITLFQTWKLTGCLKIN